MRIDNIKHLFPQVPEKKVKIKIKHIDLKGVNQNPFR
jgi:hypothetical protein